MKPHARAAPWTVIVASVIIPIHTLYILSILTPYIPSIPILSILFILSIPVISPYPPPRSV